MVFTTSHVFLRTLANAGITHAFVNLGSDHPALVEAMAELAQKGDGAIRFITCPNEMVALSCAQGYAQVCGRPAAVIVHVDCGTQALAGAVHNASSCRTPVFIYAGASPYSQETRNEFIHYLQNAVDQPQIVRQYMKHVGEIRSGKNVQQVVMRSIQYATSEPKGPVYCWAPREVTEDHLDEASVPDARLSEVWSPIELAPLTRRVAQAIAENLVKSKKPLIVTSYLGRNRDAVHQLQKLAELLAIPVFTSCPSTINIASDHPCHAGVSFGVNNPLVEEADCILILDSDIPWLPMKTKPSTTASIFHIDCDPLKDRMAMFAFPAQIRAKADCELALEQIIDAVQSIGPNQSLVATRMADLKGRKQQLDAELDAFERPASNGIMTAPVIVASLRKHAPANLLVCNEAISNYPHVWNHIKPTQPGTIISSGASSLGWALGAAIGAKLAGDAFPSLHRKDLIAVVVGDGSFIFGVPSASYWIARRYDAPFLTVVLNNGGWKSPKLSLLGVHPDGVGAKAPSEHLNVTFGPHEPDYGAIAAAAGGAWSRKVMKADELDAAMEEAIRVVTQEKRCAVLDCWLERF